MKDLPIVSVCIPAYNCEKYISRAILSILEQTYPSIEIIVIDDGSTDLTWQQVQKFESFGIVTVQQSNQGASAARNKALTMAKGKYIQFMDADDLLSPDKIEVQVAALSGKVNKIAVCSTVHFFEEERHYEKSPSPYDEHFLYTTDDPVDFMVRLWGGYNFNASMIQPNAWLTPMVLIDRAGGWNEQLTLDDDGEFFARIVLNSAGIVRTEGYNYYRKYKYTSQNLSTPNNCDSMLSLLKSTQLRNTYLLNKRKDELALKAAFRQLTELSVRSYITYPEVYRQVQSELERLPGYRYNIILGGKFLNLLTRLIGWRFAKKIQYFLKGYRKAV